MYPPSNAQVKEDFPYIYVSGGSSCFVPANTQAPHGSVNGSFALA